MNATINLIRATSAEHTSVFLMKWHAAAWTHSPHLQFGTIGRKEVQGSWKMRAMFSANLAARSIHWNRGANS